MKSFTYHGEEICVRPGRLFAEPRCQTFAAIGISLTAISVGVGVAGAAGAFTPKSPNLASSSKELSDTMAKLLPMQRQMEALAQQGGKAVIALPDGSKMPVDFTGLGTADVEGAVARKMAEVQLHLSQKYDSQFIEQSLAQEKLADPESFAARDKMSSLIQSQIERPIDSPVSDLLDKQVSASVKAAKSGRLDPETQAILDQATTDALAARGGDGGQAGDFSAPLTTGFAGEARRTAAAKAGTGWLASGQTPEDIAYRREQQNLGNLSAEVTGKTPQSQFGALRQAQNGPTPVVTGAPLAQLPTNINQTAAGGAIAAQGAQANQANLWLAGMSTLLNAGSVAGKAGWKPLGP